MTTTKQYVSAFGRAVVYIVIIGSCIGISYAIYSAVMLFFRR